jgi:hypothetical protein
MHITPERHCEILSAWMDGDPTDPASVHAALETPDGRAFIVDAMSLRRVVDVTAATSARVEPTVVARRPSWIAASAAAVICLAAGYGVARITTPQLPERPSMGEMTVMPVGAPSAPQPTHVIRFESGVDWRETVGGN